MNLHVQSNVLGWKSSKHKNQSCSVNAALMYLSMIMALTWRCAAQADLDLIASLCSEPLGVGKNDVVAVLSGVPS